MGSAQPALGPEARKDPGARAPHKRRDQGDADNGEPHSQDPAGEPDKDPKRERSGEKEQARRQLEVRDQTRNTQTENPKRRKTGKGTPTRLEEHPKRRAEATRERGTPRKEQRRPPEHGPPEWQGREEKHQPKRRSGNGRQPKTN